MKSQKYNLAILQKTIFRDVGNCQTAWLVLVEKKHKQKIQMRNTKQINMKEK